MKKLAGAVITLVLAQTVVWAQGAARVYSQPTIPPNEVLRNLNLKLAWRTYLPVDGRRDGIAMVQFEDNQMLVQLRSGGLIVLNAETGETLWRARPGPAYPLIRPIGANAKSLFVVNADRLFVLDRQTGQFLWEYRFRDIPITGVTADAERFYACVGLEQLVNYLFPYQEPPPAPPGGPKAPPAPPPGGEKKPATPARKEKDPISPLYKEMSKVGMSMGPYGSIRDAFFLPAGGPQPDLLWDYAAEVRLLYRPVQTSDLLLLAGRDGTLFATTKAVRQIIYRFKIDQVVSAPLAQYGETAYFASEDFNVYALDIPTGRIVWRFTGGAAINSKPEVQDEDIYVVPNRFGLHRLQRSTGQTIWRNANADRFLAANPKYVYATDRSNQLLILDRARGKQQAIYNTRDFVVPISNELTDRLYLASHDGLLICLHDLDYPTPVPMKKPPEPQPAKPPEEMKP